MSVQEQQATLLLNAIPEIGPARFQSLIKEFGSSAAALAAGVKSWAHIPLFEPKTIVDIETNLAESSRHAERDWAVVQSTGTRLYFLHMGVYPELLSKITYPPPVLYVQGDDMIGNAVAIALVGSRRCSYYGEKMAKQIAAELAEAGITTVSGLARGIDTFVHTATLDAGGRTWAVIGSGLSHVYPPENKVLAARIEKAGSLISEFPMATTPFPSHFPRRNRIIAGLTRGTVVIEGGEKSGSLITARLAAEEGRDVFAVPGPATSILSVAPNRLLKSGAALVQSADDILAEIGLERKSGTPILEFEQEQKLWPEPYRILLDLLGTEPVPKDYLARRLNKDASQLSSLLLEMELKGLIRSVSGGGVLKT